MNATATKEIDSESEVHQHTRTNLEYLHNTLLERVASYKYLGLLLTDNLSWSLHTANVYTKAMKVLGLAAV